MPIYLPLRTKKIKKNTNAVCMLQSTELEDSKTDPAIGPKLHVGIGTTLKSHSVDAYESQFGFESNQKLPQLASGKIRKENRRAAWDMLHFSDRPISTGYG